MPGGYSGEVDPKLEDRTRKMLEGVGGRAGTPSGSILTVMSYRALESLIQSWFFEKQETFKTYRYA